MRRRCAARYRYRLSAPPHIDLEKIERVPQTCDGDILKFCCAEAKEQKKEKCETECDGDGGKDVKGAKESEKKAEKEKEPVCKFTKVIVKKVPVEKEE